MKILVLTKYSRLGSSSRLRFLQYLPDLQAAGFQTEVCPLLGDRYIQNLYQNKTKDWSSIFRAYLQRYILCHHAGSYDVIWLESELFPWLPFGFEKKAGIHGKKLVVDYDDAVFHKYDQSPRRLIRRTLGHKIDLVMKTASLVIAGNRYIARRAELAGAAQVEILPTVVDLEKYTIHPPKTAERFTIGWIGSPGTAKYLYGIQESIQILSSKFNCRLVTIGSGSLNLPGIQLETREWKEENEADLMKDFDVGIMPLPREAWAEGKCGYKLIQYMACGIPVVASPVGVNREIVNDQIGLLAESTQDWITGIRSLQDNIELRNRMGHSGRQRVEKEFSLRKTAPKLVQWFKNLTG